MPEPPKNHTTARCARGGVELEVIGAPITSVGCYCEDCQEGSRRIEAPPNARPVRDPAAGGTAYVLYRKDRVEYSRGDRFLQDYKTCCNSAMFLNFEKGHWLSAYRARFQGDIPALQMRIHTKFKLENNGVPSDVPSYPTWPLTFVAKLVATRIAMLLHR